MNTPGFAAAVARWQKSSQLQQTGVIDDETLGQMIRSWQSHRTYKSDYPSPDQLVLVSPDDFYDPERVDELRMVERQTFEAYKRMVAAAATDSTLGLKVTNGDLARSEKYLKIISAFRTRSTGAAAPPVSEGRTWRACDEQPHFTGRALISMLVENLWRRKM